MKRGKHSVRRSGAKVLTLALALVLAVSCVVGGTLAWLTTSTSEVKNTFTAADINITLTETFNTDTNNDGTNDKWQAQMIPGYSYPKDPVVTVEKDSVDCYLFVKFEEKNDASTYLTYTSLLDSAHGWTKLEGVDNVWYRTVESSATDQSWNLLADDEVSVKDTVTKDNMADAAKAELAYTAYATQLHKNADETFTAAEAWANIAA